MIPLNEDGDILLIDKPLRWTSFDVVKKIRGTFKLKKVGHAGTLDPLATGLLIVCTGKKTKSIQGFMEMTKEYSGTMVIGKTTPSIDLETSFEHEYPWEHIHEDDCYQLAEGFVGEIEQTPPIFSAVKVKGKRAYIHARQGNPAPMHPRRVTIESFKLMSMNLPNIEFNVVCSKGTYIRSLVRDFGEQLGTGAYLSKLRRTRIGDFNVSDALQMNDIKRDEDLSKPE